MHPTRRVNFNSLIERKREQESITIEMPDGAEVTIPPALLWPDIRPAIDADDERGVLTAILGDEQVETFTSQGGTYKILAAIIDEGQGATPGELQASPAS